MTSAVPRLLVIVRAGDDSRHPGWKGASSATGWDLVVSYFGDDPHRYRAHGERRIDDKGLKWQGLHALLTREDFWRSYDYIWLPDDDLAADAATISEFFAHVTRAGLELAQPALRWGSHYAHTITMQHPSFRLRWTNFVEIMAPCFARACLERCLSTFEDASSGWGLDSLWPRLVDGARSIGIVDATPVTHTRPVGGPTHERLRAEKRSALEEGFRLLRAHGVTVVPPRVVGGLTLRDQLLDASDAAEGATLRTLIEHDQAALNAARDRAISSLRVSGRSP